MAEVKYTMNLTKEVHKQLKINAINRGMNVKEYLLSLVGNDNKKQNDYSLKPSVVREILKAKKERKNLKKYSNTEELFKDLKI